MADMKASIKLDVAVDNAQSIKPPRRQVWLDVDGLGSVADNPSG